MLFASTGITLACASIEKFGYPEWTFPILERNPDVLLGMTPSMFMLVSGFVEFFLAFTVLGAASVIGRLVAFGFQAIFVLAVFKFGPLDAVGHLMIVAILAVLVVRGPTSAPEMLVLREKHVWTVAYFMTGLYFLAFVMSFILYYGVHHLVYGI